MITTFSVLVENKFWVLTRVARLFSRNMFNISALIVAPTLDPNISCMTIDVKESDERLRRIELELKKIVNVITVNICNSDDYILTEMALLKISKQNPEFKAFIKQMELFQARVLYRHNDIEIFEFSGDRERVNRFLDVGLAHNAQSIVRTGTLAMPKNINMLTDINKDIK
jgi:acetolactate synthase I/III small subunit